MISYYIFGIIAIATVYYILRLKRQHKKEIKEVDCWKDELLKRREECIKEQSTIIEMQENILFYIADETHTLGSVMFMKMKKNENIEVKYFENFTMFFSYSRTLARNMSKNLYSEEEYKEILKFIQNDFYFYFHGGTKDLDLEMYYKLIRKKDSEYE